MSMPDAGVATEVGAIVLKLTRDRLEHGTLGIARSLGRLGVAVHVAVPDAGTPVSRSRYVRGRTSLIRRDSGDSNVLDELLDLGRRIGGRPILIAADDVAALFVEDHLQALREAFRLPAQPAGLAHRLSDKRRLHELCLETGTPTPAARFPATRDEFLRDARELGFPVVVKSIDPQLLRLRSGARSVAIARDWAAAAAIYDASEDPAQPNLMLQEHIPGDAEAIWMFNGYFDTQGRCAIGYVGQKIRQAPPRTGATTLGRIAQNDTVRDQAIGFLEHLGYRGIVDLGFRFDARDARYKLLDVNPRIGSTFRLFVGQDGLDVARALYLDLTDQAFRASPIKVGRRWLVEDLDLATAVKLWRARELSIPQYIGSLRGIDETAWLARDDLRPAVAVLGASVGKLTAIVRRRLASTRTPRPASAGAAAD